MNRRILDKLMAALDIHQGTYEEKNSSPNLPIDEGPIKKDCVPFGEAIPRLFPGLAPTGKCNPFHLLGPLEKWPCVCLSCEADGCIISCVENTTWDQFYTRKFIDAIGRRACSYVSSMVEAGCLEPTPDISDWWPPIFHLPFVSPENPDIVTGDERGTERLLQLAFNAGDENNECLECLSRMMGILHYLIERIRRKIGEESHKERINNDFIRLWMDIVKCSRARPPLEV